jgi:guanine deaminase
MALITGKTMMDRNAPNAVRDDPERGILESEELIYAWQGRGRLAYAITPRFAVTSSDAQLKAAGELARRFPDCTVQSHLSESAAEIVKVASLFPSAADYTDVYDRFGLLSPKSLFAHGIHLSERECARLSEAGSKVVHCPTSNTFLGSGLFDIDRLGDRRRPVGIGIGSDIGGGTSYSMLANLGEAHKVAMLKGRKLGALRAFHIATLGNARLLGLEQEIGTLDAGKWADVVVLDPLATPVLAARQELSENVEDVLFSLMILGDDRAVRATYLAGKRVHGERP